MPAPTFPTLFLDAVTAGFPSPADDYIERRLDLNDLLIPHPYTTVVLKVENAQAACYGILPDDLLIIDRSLPFRKGQLVIAQDHIYRLGERKNSSDDRHYLLNVEQEKRIIGVITARIRCFKER